MGVVETALNYIRTSERLIVITVTLSIAGLLSFLAEKYEYLSFAGLPEWPLHIRLRTCLNAADAQPSKTRLSVVFELPGASNARR
jgi:hypothetical protein